MTRATIRLYSQLVHIGSFVGIFSPVFPFRLEPIMNRVAFVAAWLLV